MKFRIKRKNNSFASFSMRHAQLEDAEFFSDLTEMYENYYMLNGATKSSEKFRIDIGSGLIKGNYFSVVEDIDGNRLGFIEVRHFSRKRTFIGYPYVIINCDDFKAAQEYLLHETLMEIQSNANYHVSTQISSFLPDAIELFEQEGFSHQREVFQMWDAEILPLDTIDIEPYSVRRIVEKDFDVTYSWINRQLDPLSPLYLPKSQYWQILTSPQMSKDGWAVAVDENRKPVALVCSMLNPHSNSAIIFGPYCDSAYETVRIPLLNELFLFLRLNNYTNAHLMRSHPFDNDIDLFDQFGFELLEETIYLAKD